MILGIFRRKKPPASEPVHFKMERSVIVQGLATTEPTALCGAGMSKLDPIDILILTDDRSKVTCDVCKRILKSRS